jgi:hypothetical protein
MLRKISQELDDPGRRSIEPADISPKAVQPFTQLIKPALHFPLDLFNLGNDRGCIHASILLGKI